MSESTYAADTVSAPAPVLSVSPVVLSAPSRAVDLQVRVSAPVTGSELPIILLSHGQGPSNNLSSLNGYAPLANFWAAHGFVVIQPTHLSSRTLSLNPDDPEAPLYWRSRAEVMKRILDQLDLIETAVPQLPGRLDRSKVAVAGHSMGGHTASLRVPRQNRHRRTDASLLQIGPITRATSAASIARCGQPRLASAGRQAWHAQGWPGMWPHPVRIIVAHWASWITRSWPVRPRKRPGSISARW
jgi:dienelactone hydrolase